MIAAAALCMSAGARGQTKSAQDLGIGKVLVSSRATGDPAFMESVVLLLQYDRQGALGLMINRRTEAPISRVLKDVNTAKRGSDPVYFGGPVELDAVFALLRSGTKPDDAAAVLNGVYVVSAKQALEKALAASNGDRDVRVYVGYCGWGGGQLEHEVTLGGWWIFAGDPGDVFDPQPGSVWTRLIARTEQQVAGALPPEAGWLSELGSLAEGGGLKLRDAPSGARGAGW